MTAEEHNWLQFLYKLNGGDISGESKIVKYIGQGTSFDIKSLYPDAYKNFTSNNFICEPVNFSWGGGSNFTGVGQPLKDLIGSVGYTKNYNNTNGILSVYTSGTASVNAQTYSPATSGNGPVQCYMII